MTIAACAALVAVAAWGAWVGVRAVMAKDELERMMPVASQLREGIAAGDAERSALLADELAERAARASALTGDALWRAAEVVPVVGRNLAGARVASQQIDALSADVIGPLLDLGRTLSEGAGGLDTTTLVEARPSLGRAVEALRTASTELGAAMGGPLLGPLSEGLTELAQLVDAALPAVTAVSDAADVLPPLLGHDAPRSVLVMVQNNAELRTGGGIAGAFVELRADAGALELVDQASSSDFDVVPGSVLPLPEGVTALSGPQVGQYVVNSSMTADYDLTARLASEWWNLRTAHRPDAVVSIDPHVLAALLGVVGPVEVPEWGEVNADNAVQRLLVDPYLQIDEDAEQNALFQSVAATVFERLSGSGASPLAVVAALAGPVDQGRVSVWSAHPDEQDLLGVSAVGGPLARQRLAGDDAFAVYLNDATGAKMDSFLDIDVATSLSDCRGDGRRDVSVSVTLANTAPADAATSLRPRMTGDGIYDVPAGSIATYVAVSAPPGSFVGGVSAGGGARHSTEAIVAGHPVSQAPLTLAPGETGTLEFRFIAAEPGDLRPVVLHTPTVGTVGMTGATTASCPS